MDNRKERIFDRLKKQRELLRVREAEGEFTVFQGLKSALSGFVDLSGTQNELEDALEDTFELLEELLEQDERTGIFPPEVVDIFIDLQEHLKDHFAEKALWEKRAQLTLSYLLEIEKDLKAFDLSLIFSRLEREKEEKYLLQEAQSTIHEAELEMGFYERIVNSLDDLIYHDGDPVSTIELLESIHQDTLERLENYDTMQLPPSDWTVAVALADRLMLEGFELMLDSLEHLLDLCESGEEDEGNVPPLLENIRQANKCWILVERMP